MRCERTLSLCRTAISDDGPSVLYVRPFAHDQPVRMLGTVYWSKSIVCMPPFDLEWACRSSCCPAFMRNTVGGLCAPTPCMCKHKGTHHHPFNLLSEPPVWFLAGARMLNDFQSRVPSEPNPALHLDPDVPRVLTKPVPPARLEHHQYVFQHNARYRMLKNVIKRKEESRASERLRKGIVLDLPRPAVSAPVTQEWWGDAMRLVKHANHGTVVTCFDNTPDAWLVPLQDGKPTSRPRPSPRTGKRIAHTSPIKQRSIKTAQAMTELNIT